MVTYKGDLVDGLIQINRTHEIDLVILRPQSNDIQDELYLGTTSGSIIKKTNISALIVPRGAVYTPFQQILTAFKSGILKRNSILNPFGGNQEQAPVEAQSFIGKNPWLYRRGFADQHLFAGHQR